jgi:outer membrane protein assembly factor BamB
MHFALALAALLIAQTDARSSNPSAAWPQWRGPQRDGRVAGLRLPAQMPAQLKKLWSVQVGEGYSSPIIVEDRAYVLVRVGEQEVTRCLDLRTGRQRWEHRVEAPFDSVIFPARRFGKSPRSTPLWHQGKLYTLGINGLLSCLDARTGKVLWSRDFSKAFPTPMPICGASLSPLIVGKRLLVHAGHDNVGAFFALDKDSGRDIWAWKGEGPAYTSPVLARIGGMPQIITAAHNMWIGLDLETGALLWSIKNRENMFNHNSITPAVVGDTVILGANQRPTMAVRIQRRGDRWQAEKLWETRAVTLSTASPLVLGSRVVALNEKRRGQLTMLRLDTGEVAWECPGNKGEHASLYTVGAYMLAFTSTGELYVYRVDGDIPREAARYQVADSAMWASPAIAGNLILTKGVETLTLWEMPTR